MSIRGGQATRIPLTAQRRLTMVGTLPLQCFVVTAARWISMLRSRFESATGSGESEVDADAGAKNC